MCDGFLPTLEGGSGKQNKRAGESHKVTETFYRLKRADDICMRTEYTTTSYYIWWGVRSGEEHWMLREYDAEFYVTTYVEKQLY